MEPETEGKISATSREFMIKILARGETKLYET
jgi:hypothetical protein